MLLFWFIHILLFFQFFVYLPESKPIEVQGSKMILLA